MTSASSDALKRTMDVAVGGVALLLLWPLLVLTAIAVAVESGRPVLFRQTRVGRNGVHFRMVKFRSMVFDASTTGPHFTTAGDPRVTRVGRIIRRTSLDELPQLWNVVRGDMSLVGPRPDLPEQRTGYTEQDWLQRCSVRPGITGLSQALYRSESTETERLEADLRYTRERSLALDLRILMMTAKRLRGTGSN